MMGKASGRPAARLALFCLLAWGGTLSAAEPRTVLYQGSLGRSGAAVTGNGTFVIRITNADGSAEYWTSGSTSVAVSNGLFRYPLGTPNEAAFEAIDWAAITPYVEVRVDGVLFLPRVPLLSGPYALLAGSVGGIAAPGDAILAAGFGGGGGDILVRTGGADRLHVTNAGDVGIGISTPAARLDVGGDASFGSGPSKSTVTAAGGMNLASGAGLQVSGGGRLLGVPLPGGDSEVANKDYVDAQAVTGSGWTDAGSTLRPTNFADSVLTGSSWTVGGAAFSVGGSTFVIRDGQLGIGASPSARVTVAGDVRLSAGSGGVLVFADGSTMESTNTASAASLSNTADALLVADEDLNGTGDVVFRAGADEDLKILNGGNVGLGTSRPATRLDVEGAAQFGNAVSKAGFGSAGQLTLASGANLAVSGGGRVTGLGLPAAASDAASKAYVDAQLGEGSGWFDSGTVVRQAFSTDNVVVASTLTVQGHAFSVGAATLAVRDGRLGVGADAPRTALQIGALASGTGEPTFPGQVVLQGAPAASEAAGGLEFKHASGGGGSGWKLTSLANATDDLRLASRRGTAGWTDRLILAGDTGAVGVGASPTSAPLSVGGDLRLTGAGRFVFPDGTSLGSAADPTAASNDGDALVIADSDGDGSGDVVLRVGSSDRLRVANGGNVGVGVSSPSALLDVGGTAQFGAGGAKSTFTATGALSLASGTDLTLVGGGKVTGLSDPTGASDAARKAYADTAGATLAGWADDGTVVRLVGGSDAAVVASSLTALGAAGIGASGLGNGALVVRSTSATAANPVLALQANGGSELFRVQQDGRAGLGGSAPAPADGAARTLQLGSNLILQDVLGSQALFGDNAYYDGTWRYRNAGAARALRLGGDGSVSVHLADAGAQDAAIVGWDTTAVRLRVTSAGDVGIGLPVPGARLDVEGGAQFGAGSTKSTFTATGSLQLAAGTDLPMGGAKVTGLSDPAGATDAARKAYVDLGGTALSGWADDGTVLRLASLTDAVVAGASATVTGTVGIGASGLGNGALVVRSTSSASGNPVLALQSAAGAELFRLQQDGLVGVGTASPAPADGAARTLQIGSNAVLQNPGGNELLIGDNVYFDGAWRYRAVGTASALRFASGGLSIHVAGSGAAGAAIPAWNGSDLRLLVTAAGDVGVGSISPATKLHVSSGAVLIDGNASTAFRVGTSTFLVLGSGFVGIGVVPAQPLDVVLGSSLVRFSGAASSGGGLILGNTDGGTQEWSLYSLGASPGSLGRSRGFALLDRTASDAPRLTLDKSGNLGLKTAAPAATLHAAGFGIIASSLTVGGAAAALGAASTDLTATGSAFFGTAGSYKVTNAGAATLAASTVGDLTGTGITQQFGTLSGGTLDKYVFWDGAPGSGTRVFALQWNGGTSRFGARANQYNATGAPDLAEMIQAERDVEEWDVVVASPRPTREPGPGGERVQVARAARPYDPAILGVISDGSGGLTIQSHMTEPGQRHPGKPLVLAGRVPVKVSLENGPIRPGDALTSSSRPGRAMRATAPGPTVGIALEAFDGSAGAEGRVLCLVDTAMRNAGAEAAGPDSADLRALAKEVARLRAASEAR